MFGRSGCKGGRAKKVVSFSGRWGGDGHSFEDVRGCRIGDNDDDYGDDDIDLSIGGK